MSTYAQNRDIAIPSENIFDYAYQRTDSWSGSKFAQSRSFSSNSYSSVIMGVNYIWGSDATIEGSACGIYSGVMFGYRLSPVHNIELAASYGVLPYTDWQVSRLGEVYNQTSYTSQNSLSIKYLFNVTSYANRLEDPDRFEFLIGAGANLHYFGDDGLNEFAPGANTSLRFKYNITNMLSLHLEPSMSLIRSQLGGGGITTQAISLCHLWSLVSTCDLPTTHLSMV
ncbi:MAG: hypothetical protein SNJ33_06185 [Rikenellaceae bacterium]